jgi:hypothetical protein
MAFRTSGVFKNAKLLARMEDYCDKSLNQTKKKVF